MISERGLLCDHCEKRLRHYVVIYCRKILVGEKYRGFGWFEGHRNCFLKEQKKWRGMHRNAGIRREYQQ